ncbi:TylF/MycF family methyltransferase [Antribacter sp. KLBMP9083]|uniref:TylF/MycF family methyltransferase n=1 Tax=Antribacter soli TaxID=2910976 RepID=A0AA41QGA5_9MICO|nr:TylF/MycF/NovP-related O-methyltransferase [Antribacter soli]MCF4122240.1 TylF/MycF family methyltransferase [Antribacter soli]
MADPAGVMLIERVRRNRLTYLPRIALLNLRERMHQLERDSVPGSVIEAGCALGGSAIVLAASKAKSRRMTVHDVFGTIPPPSDNDGDDVKSRYQIILDGQSEGIGGDVYYGYRSDLKAQVAASFADLGVPTWRNNVTLVQGLFEDTVDPEGPVALAHLDGDWYESVKVCLERIWPKVSVGGAVVVDDYDAWSGCRRAVDEFLGRQDDVRVERAARPHLVKVG